jgi:hypothetical protein
VVSITPRPLYPPGERAPDTHWIGGWVGSRAVLNPLMKRKIPRTLKYNLEKWILKALTGFYWFRIGVVLELKII